MLISLSTNPLIEKLIVLANGDIGLVRDAIWADQRLEKIVEYVITRARVTPANRSDQNAYASISAASGKSPYAPATE